MRLLLLSLLLLLAACAGDRLHAQTQVTPGYQVTNTSDPGDTHTSWQPTTPSTPLPVTMSPSSAVGVIPSPLAPALATAQIIKGSGGSLYSFEVSADSTLSAAAWWILIYDAAADPGNGTVAPRKCYAQATGVTSVAYAWTVPIAFKTGIVIVVSTTGCYTETQSAHAFISGDAQ
jgi:hypothetical protein